MFELKVKTEDTTKNVADASQKAAFKNFGHAAASIAKDVKSTLEKADGPSQPGSPPHTHKGTYLRRAVRFAADAEGAVIGPMASVVGEAGAAHEFGEVFHETDYPERPYMGPGLERGAPRFAQEWAGSIG